MFTLLVDRLSTDTQASLAWVRPEVTLVVTIVLLLASRLFPGVRRIDPFWIALAGTLASVGFLIAESLGGLASVGRLELFTGMLVHDGVGVYSRGLLLVFSAVFLLLCRVTCLAQRDDAQDFFVLVLGGVLGMCLMCRANHLMTVFLAVEMASVPSYVLAGIVKGRRRAGEAALKYSVYGAAAAGVMLYGISLLAGLTGTAHLPTLAERLAAGSPPDSATAGYQMALALSAVLLSAGLAFKLSATPFQFWAPDVFAGAPAEVGAYLSVASKTASIVLLVRLAAVVAPGAIAAAADAPAEATAAWGPAGFVATLLAVMAACTCTFGNLAAFGQENAKRLLAYSTIAHAGYLIMPVAAAVAMVGRDRVAAEGAVAAVLLYAAGYALLNTTAFTAIALLRNLRASETLSDYAGLIRTAPVIAISLAAAMLGLLGLPPSAGFVGKLAALRSVASAGQPLFDALVLVAVVNTALSLYYYLRVVRITCLDPPATGSSDADAPNDDPQPGADRAARALLVCLAAPILLVGLAPETLARWASDAASGLFG